MVVNAFTLQRKYPQFQVNDINALIDQFRQVAVAGISAGYGG